MNMPYSTAKDAVEFWQPIANLFNLPVSLGYADAYRDSYVIVVGDQQGITLEEFTRDMLARCDDHLFDHNAWCYPLACGGFVARRWRNPGVIDSRSDVIAEGSCRVEIRRNAVLAVSGEGGG